MHSNFYQPPISSSTSHLFSQALINDPSPIMEKEENTSQCDFSEEEIASKKNAFSFFQLPFSMKSMSQLEKKEFNLQNIKKIPQIDQYCMNSDTNLTNNFNEKYYKNVKMLLGEELEEGYDCVIMNLNRELHLNDDASPKTLYDKEFHKPKPETNHLYLRNKTSYEVLQDYEDAYCFLAFRILLMKIKSKIQFYCYKIITNRAFEALCLLVILWNTIMLFLDDPIKPSDLGNNFDLFFLIYYTVEMGMKIMALGFIWDANSYLRSGWNWLDMTIVVTGYLPYIITSNNSISISVLRSVRVIRPLKTITSLKNLMMIVMTLFSAFPFILNTLLILFFFLMIYAIIGTQLLQGVLKKRCINQFTGLMLLQNPIFDSSYNGFLCGYLSCPDPDNNICSKLIENPNSNITNFDNFLWSLLMMVQDITLENWSYNMYYVARTFDYYGALIIFITLTFIGAFIFLNLMASVISSSYHEQAGKVTIKKSKEIKLYDQHVLEFLAYERQNRSKKTLLKNPEIIRNTNTLSEIRLQEINDLKKHMVLTIPQEIELQKISDQPNSTEKAIFHGQNNMIHQFSIEEMAPFVNTISPKNDKLRPSNEQHNDKKIEIRNNINKSFNEDILFAKTSNIKEENGITSHNGFFGTLNNLKDVNTEVEINRKSEKIDKNIKENNSWYHKLTLNNLFNKSVQEKFKNWKLGIDHMIEYESSSINDVIALSIVKKKLKEEQIFEEKLKKCKFEVIYNIRQNFKVNKQEIKEEYERKLLKKYMGFDIKQANQLIKETFFYLSGDQIRLPLKIDSDSFVFNAKMERLADLNYQRKKNIFQKHLLHKDPKKPFRKKRLQSLVFTSQEIKSSFIEKLYSQEDEQILKEFNNEKEYKQIRVYDYENRKLNDQIKGINWTVDWSGKEVLNYPNIKDMNIIIKSIKQENQILEALSTYSQEKTIWMNGVTGKIKILRKIIREFTESKLFEFTMLAVVILNTIVLSTDGYFQDPEQIKLMETINTYMVYIFAVEMSLKIMGYGFYGYIRSRSNLFDGLIVVISIVDLIESSINSNLNALRSVRILRVLRILRPLEYMKVITRVLASNFSSFIYICLLLILLIIIYTLIGNQVYMKQLNNAATGIRQSFDTLYSSFLVVFELVSIANWNDVETITLNSSVPTPFTIFYLLSLIFLGNYVFLNLFLGIVINGFSKGQDESEQNQDKEHVTINLEELGRFKKLYYEEVEEDHEQKKLTELAKNSKKLRLTTDLDDDNMDTNLENFMDSKTSKLENPYQEWHCEESLWLFNKRNLFRRICFVIVNSEYFKKAIFFLILANSIKLFIDTYIQGSFSDIFDDCLGSCLIIEALMKIVAYGFFLEPMTYLRDDWHKFDFCLVIVSIIDIALIDSNLHFLKVFLLIRTVKLLSMNTNMKILVSALIKSIGPLLNLIIFTSLIFLIFSLIGINFLGDRMGVCNNDPTGQYYGINEDQCKIDGGSWMIADTNFDNVFNAMITVFILSTQENWNYIMYLGIDSNPSDIGPELNNYKYISIYFIIALVVLNFFLINLFVGVLCDQFLEAKAKADPLRVLSLTDGQRQWIEFLEFLPKIKAKKGTRTDKQNNKFQVFFRKIIESRQFELLLILCIIGNIITLAMNYEGEPESYTQKLETVNYFFTGAFMLEALLKIVGLGFHKYFHSGWNIFDFLIVVTSTAEIIFVQLSTGNNNINFIRVGPQIIRIFRVLRVLRILKLIKRLETLKKLITTLITALPSIANVGLLYLMVFYIYAILGVLLFKDVKTGMQIDDLNNFSDAGSALVLVFKTVTGENWWQFMFDCYRLPPDCDPKNNCGSALAPVYFISCQVIGTFIVQSLFILAILQTLEKANEENSWLIFKEVTKKFKNVWKNFAQSEDPYRISTTDLITLFRAMPDPLGFKNIKSSMMIAVEIMKMNLESDSSNHVSFYDVLFSTLKRVYLVDIDHPMIKDETIGYLNHVELVTREKMDGFQRRFHKHREHAMLIEGNGTRRRQKKKTANPMVKLLWMPMLFNSWKKYCEMKKEGRFDEMDSVDVEEVRERDKRKSRKKSFFDKLFKK